MFFRLKTAEAPNADTLFPRFNTRFRYSGRTALQARKAAEMQNREEPHIARTAERKSMGDKAKNKDGNVLNNWFVFTKCSKNRIRIKIRYSNRYS